MKIQHILDKEVTPILDLQFRNLLCTCFVDESALFAKQRFFNEMPTRRYYVSDGAQNMVAHVAVHDKTVTINDITFTIAGIAEVCVLPNYRRLGLVKKLLTKIHEDLKYNSIDFSLLFGEEHIYNSSGYEKMNNLYMLVEDKWKPTKAMVYSISTPWPGNELVKLEGQPF